MIMRLLAIGLAIAPSGITVLPAQAQSVEPGQPAAELPRFTDPTAPAVTQSVPTATITRDQAPLPLQTVYQTPIEQFEPAFADVPVTHWAYEAVTRLYYGGIVQGYDASATP